MRLNKEQKESVIKNIWIHGTLERGASESKVSLESIHAEMKVSAVFKKRIKKALEESKGMLIDEARALVRDYMRGVYLKTDRNRLTAAIALLNAYEPGFKGTTTVQGRIDHDVRVITAVPRPLYPERIEDKRHPKVFIAQEDKDKLKALNAGKPINTIEDVIEGEVIKETDNDARK